MTWVIIAAFVLIGIGVWMWSSGEAATEEPKAPAASSFRCKLCDRKSATFVEAHEHASADHELAGHQIDESIVAE